jgi:regulatory protein
MARSAITARGRSSGAARGGQETPVPGWTAERASIERTPADRTPIERTPIERTPIERTPIERTPIERTPIERTPIERARAADPASVARTILLRQLTVGPRTRAQLAAALARKGVPDDVAAAVLDRFEQIELVDDAEFARQWVQTRHAGRGLARRALAHELRHRGVDDETVRAAVDQLDDDAELVAARTLVRRRARSMAHDEPARRARRLAGILARKGYSSAVALRAIRECGNPEVDVDAEVDVDV